MHKCKSKGLQSPWDKCKRRLNGQWLDVIVAITILVNSFVMSVELEHKGTKIAHSVGLQAEFSHWPNAEISFKVLEYLFLIIFLLELAVRIRKDRLKYFYSVSNCFDV